ncbi:MAG: PAAR domain-containing protein [Deltaproteobacteria bacterium]|nr:PAAR domain-containing protein [Deltaproteobacteria bacterium]
MSGQAARVGDNHVCPQLTGLVPHGGGPVLPPGAANVQICGKPAAVVGNPAQCNGPMDTIVKGSSTVFIGGKPAARLGDMTAHGGTITSGCGNVLIGN